MKRNLLLIGGGGHCKSIIDSLRSGDNLFDKIGIIDVQEKTGFEIEGVKTIGTDDDLQRLFLNGYNYAFLSLGSVGNPNRRIEMYKELKQIGFIFPNILDKCSVIAQSVKLNEGIYVGKGAIINSGSRIDTCAIINTGALVEHDCQIGSFSHIAPGSVICGNVRIGDHSHVGANATVIQGITVGKDTIIGAGSTIISDISNGVTVVGSPGRQVK